jgi:hypothetical protein
MTTNGKLESADESPLPAEDDPAPRAKRRARSPRGRRATTSSEELRDSSRSLADTAADIYKRALEAGDYGKALLEVHQDRAGLAIRRKTTQVVLIAISVCVGITALITATLLVIHGIADGLTDLFAGRQWLGNLVAGVLLLGIGAAAIAGSIRRRDKVQLAKQVKKYEQLRNRHRSRHGRHVADDKAFPHGGGTPGLGGADGARGPAPQSD